MSRFRRALARWVWPEGAAVSDQMHACLTSATARLYERRYTPEGLSACCYDACDQYERLTR